MRNSKKRRLLEQHSAEIRELEERLERWRKDKPQGSAAQTSLQKQIENLKVQGSTSPTTLAQRLNESIKSGTNHTVNKINFDARKFSR